MRGNERVQAWLGSTLALLRDRVHRAHLVAVQRVGPTLARWRDRALHGLEDRRIRAVAVALGMSLLLAPGLARFWRDPPPTAEAAALRA